MQTPLRIIAGALLGLVASGAFGLGFGRTGLNSSLGQPLSFALTVRLSPGEDLQAECIKASVLSGDNALAPSAVRTQLRGQTGDVNEHAVVISTTSVIDEPIVTVNVTLGCPPSMTRSFVAFVDPPALNLARSAPPAPSLALAPEAVERPAPAPRPPQPRSIRPAPPPAPRAPRAASAAASSAPTPSPSLAAARAAAVAPAPAPTLPASAPSASARSSSPVTARNAPAPAAAGPRLQLDAPRVEPRGPATALSSAGSGPTSAATAASSAATAASATASTKGGSPAAAGGTAGSAQAAGRDAAASAPTAALGGRPAASAVTGATSQPAAQVVASGQSGGAAASGPAGGGRVAASGNGGTDSSAAATASPPGGTVGVAGAGAGAAGAGAGVAAAGGAATDAERLRMQAVEDNLVRLRAESLANQRTLLSIQAQLREAESSRYANPFVYILALLCLLLAAALAWIIWQRGRDRSELAWWASPEGEALRAAATQIMASGHAPLGERTSPSAFQDSASKTMPRSMPAPLSDMTLPAVASAAPVRSPVAATPAPANGALALGSSSTSMRGATTTIVEPPRREISVEELMDLEQQVDFFVVLGQDESAIELLLGHLRGSGAANPLPYLKLIEIYQRRGERDAYERIRERFNQQFNGVVPPFGTGPDEGRDVEDYPQLLSRLHFLWADPSQALEVLETAIFGRNDSAQRFDLPAYRNLLFLYTLARDLASRESTGQVDVLLPLGDDFVDSGSPMLSTMSVKTNPAAQRPLEVDFDVSQPGAFEPSERGQGYGDVDFGSGFGALSDDLLSAPKPRKPDDREF